MSPRKLVKYVDSLQPGGAIPMEDWEFKLLKKDRLEFRALPKSLKDESVVLDVVRKYPDMELDDLYQIIRDCVSDFIDWDLLDPTIEAYERGWCL